MECVAVFFLFVLGGVTALVFLGSRVARHRRQRKLFQQLAKQFSGACDRGGLFARPAVRLRYGETAAVVCQCKTIGPFTGPGLQVRIAWPFAQLKGEVVTVSARLRQRVASGWPTVDLNDTEFDGHFFVASPAPQDIQQLFTSGVKWQLNRLRTLGDKERLYVLIRDGQIVVQKYWHGPRVESAADIVRAALELYDQCMLARVSGIEFVESEQIQALGEITCKICGELIADHLVYCGRCKTPHHQECWEYAGVCSVFGCRETTFLLPQRAQSLAPATDQDRPVNKPR